MQPNALWSKDDIFVEIGARDAELVRSLRHHGMDKFLGVSGDARRIEQLQAKHPEVADCLTHSQRERLVLHNNADVLVLSGAAALYVWKYKSVRHAKMVAWRCGLSIWSLLALVGCLFHLISGRYSLPRLVKCAAPGTKTRRMFVSRVLRQKLCHRQSLHFIPHQLGLRGMFRQFDHESVSYVVLRWFEPLPQIEPSQDVDMLVADDSLADVLAILHSRPGIQPCDIYSETGLQRADFCGTPYYPPRVARRLLDGAVRHKNLCQVPSASDYFHSLSYHAVYHKGMRSGLPTKTGLPTKGTPGHDYAGILRAMAESLGIDVEIGMEGLQAYLQDNDWGPTPDMLMRLATHSPRNKWLNRLAAQLNSDTNDPGLAVFALRQEAVRLGFTDLMVGMIRDAGFEIVAVKTLEPHEVEIAAARTRGGNWGVGPYNHEGGPPVVAVVAYDRDPLPASRKQLRRFPQRTNGRLYVKEKIRDAVNSHLPPEQQCNALHSSDYGAEAKHLIDVFCPELVDEIDQKVAELRGEFPAVAGRVEPAVAAVRRAA